MTTFKAFRVHNEDNRISGRLEEVSLEDLSQGDVVIRAAWSDVNYKDALAVTGAGKIMRRFPLVAGIDVAGTVAQTTDPRFREGDAVLVTGCGLGETHDGGYSEYVRVPADWVVPLPDGLSLEQAMALGTAGFTAALAVERMEHNGQSPEQGPVVVTGATGGVGSLAIDMLAGRGYEVHAITGKAAAGDYLKRLGVHTIVDRHSLEFGTRPLERGVWGGAVDTLGGEVLGWLTRPVKPWGNIASIGLAGGAELETTVMPFILRGVSLLGIYSVEVPMPLRRKVWQRLASDLRPRHLDEVVTQTVALADIAGVFTPYVEGKVTGRTLVRIGG